MQHNTRCLLAACQQLAIPYEVIGAAQHCVRIQLKAGHWHYFSAHRSPFNCESIADICRDKQHTYDLLHRHIRMPKTLNFLDPHTDPKYQHYLTYPTLPSIVQAITNELTYPLVIKPNRGSLGTNVVLCHDIAELNQALHTIFDHASRAYDYLVLAQQYIPTAAEYRVICYQGEPLLAYQRCNQQALTFNVRYWENGTLKHIQAPECLNELMAFAQPIFAVLPIVYVGLDIVRGVDGQWYLLELNSGPRYDHFIAQYGDSAVVAAYVRMLESRMH